MANYDSNITLSEESALFKSLFGVENIRGGRRLGRGARVLTVGGSVVTGGPSSPIPVYRGVVDESFVYSQGTPPEGATSIVIIGYI